MSTSSNLDCVGPGETAAAGGGAGRVVQTNSTGPGGVVGNSPYIRLSSLAVPATHHQALQQQQHHPVYQKVVDPTSASFSNKTSLQKTVLASSNNNPSEDTSLPTSNPLVKGTPTYEIQDNEPYIVTVRNSPARSLVKSASGTSVPSSATVPAGLKVFSGVSKAGPRLALYRSNSSLDLLDRDNYLNNHARAFHHSHVHQLSPQYRGHLMNNSSTQNSHPHNQFQGNNNNGTNNSVGVTTGCFTRRKDFGSHGSIDVLSSQNASLLSGGGGHTVRSGSVGTGTSRPFLSLMNPDGIKSGEHVDSGSVSNISASIEDSKSLPVSSKVSGISARETASPRLRLKFQKLWEHGSNKDKNSSNTTNNGNEKGMGNVASSSSSTSAVSNKSESSKQLFRKFRGASSASRQQASKSLPEAGKFDTGLHIEASDGVTTKVVLRHNGGTNPMEERFRRRALAHYDCQSISANISYAAKLRGLLSKRRNTTTGASAASLCQRAVAESNGGSEGGGSGCNASGTVSGGSSPTSGQALSIAQQSSSSHTTSTSSSTNLLQIPGQQQDTDLGDGKSNALVSR